jgi:DNA-binding CsgD family transcriptional regulator
MSGQDRPLNELVATGLTNGQSAERLMLGTGTVRNDVGNVLQQPGFATRTQRGVWTAA